MGLSLIFLFFIMNLQPAAAQHRPALPGYWEGGISLQGTQLSIKTHFNKNEAGFNGTIDIQGVTLPLQEISVTDNDSVFFQFTAGPGLAEFKGSFESDSTISGNYYQNNTHLTFKLKRYEQESDKIIESTQPDLPYNHEDLIIKNDSIDIGGTLTWPKNESTNQLVIMISGSGAQDRDESMQPVSDFKPFAELADSLTVNGIATFRYDDRGVGQSTGNFGNATLNILASDVDAIINNLTNRPNHNFEEIILLGHSQGGVVAGKVAAENEAVDKLILMASTGVSLKEVVRFQVQQAFAPANLDQALIEKEITARENLMQAIADDKNVDEAKEKYQQQFKAVQLAAGADSSRASALAKQQANQLAATFQAPQTQSLLFYNPTDDLKELNIPVLVLFGGKDTQVTVNMNKKPIESALDEAGVPDKIKVFKNANHLFQQAKTGQVQEYGSLPSKFVDGFTSVITQWIKK